MNWIYSKILYTLCVLIIIPLRLAIPENIPDVKISPRNILYWHQSLIYWILHQCQSYLSPNQRARSCHYTHQIYWVLRTLHPMKQSQLGTRLPALGRPMVHHYQIDKAPLLPRLDLRRELFRVWCRHISPGYCTTLGKLEEPWPREELTNEVHWRPVFPSRWRDMQCLG